MDEGFSVEDSKKLLEEITTDDFKSDFSTMLRTKQSLFFVSTSEELRFVSFLEHFCRVEGYSCSTWDVYDGLISIEDGQTDGSAGDEIKDPLNILDHIITTGGAYVNKKEQIDKKVKEGTRGIVFVLCDYFRFLEEPAPEIERRLRTIAKLNSFVSVILTGPNYVSTSVIENLMPNIDFPPPNRKEYKRALYEVVNGVKNSPKLPNIEKDTKKNEEDIINAVTGLTVDEAQSAVSKSIVVKKKCDIPRLLKEKKQIIKKNGMLEFYEPNVSMEDVGGLKNLKKWIKERKVCFSQEAADYGLKKPRGVLILGCPGAGKSLVCKAVSSIWNMPLLKLDFGKLFGSLVGDSEKNIRSALSIAELVSPSILWLDEIEKAISGGRSSSQSDGGTTNRVLSTFLTWMQEKTKPVFVIATANEQEGIPKEFLRAGRFDEIFYAGLPNGEERSEIFSIHLRKHNLDPNNFSLDVLSFNSKGYSGAEIEKSVDCALLVGFSEKKRKIKDKDITNALGEFKPLSVLREEDFLAMDEWVKTSGCRVANAEEKTKKQVGMSGAKNIDI